jgi:hypothetical protein
VAVRNEKRVETWPLLALLTCALMGTAATACGGSGSARSSSSQTAQASEPPPTATTTSTIPPGQPVRGDGDADNPGDVDGNGDSDAASVGGPDVDSDSPTTQSYRFPDSDDGATFAFGHRPSAAAGRAIASVVERYYAAASKSDGAAGCALLQPSLARSLPESYGGPLGPSYLRGARTCGTTLSLFFRHYHAQLAASIEVFAVRVQGSTARAIFSSRTMPASDVFLTAERSSWRPIEVLGHPLP